MNVQLAITAIKELNMTIRPRHRSNPPSVEQDINAHKALYNKLIAQLDIISQTPVNHHALSVKQATFAHQLLELLFLLKE